MNKEQETLLLKFGIFLAIYLIAGKPILNFLGITKSKMHKLIESETQNPNSPFSANFWRSYYYQGGAPANGRAPLTSTMLAVADKAAIDLFKHFGLWIDDEGAIKAVFTSQRSKAAVSLIAQSFKTKFGKELLWFLQNGKDVVPHNGLSDSELSEILFYVNNLPAK